MEGSAKEKQVTLSLQVDKTVPNALVGDSLRLKQVLLNLMTNAIKFSDAGARVELAINLVRETPDKACVRFSIKDTGIGISPEQQTRLFKAFSQADSSTTRNYGGSGLGLIISQQIVQMMNGEIKLESEVNVGSVFYFDLCLKKQSGEIAVESSRISKMELLAASNALRGTRVLLAEDNEINQMLTRDLLSVHGVKLEIAENGSEALYKLMNDGPFDGVLMDCQMPGMDGYEATRQLREIEQYASLPIIALTAHAMRGDREKAIEAGMNDYLSKPIDPDRLLLVMARWIRPGSSLG